MFNINTCYKIKLKHIKIEFGINSIFYLLHVCNNNLNYGLGMLLQRSKHNIDYKIQNLFYSVKVYTAKFSQRLMCSYSIVLCHTVILNMGLVLLV